MAVFEDPDELGYYTEHARKPVWKQALTSTIICNDILDVREQSEIVQAALLAHQGHDIDAERSRKFAGYDRVGFRPDADGSLVS